MSTASPYVLEKVARASFKLWADHNNNTFVFEDMGEKEREFALKHADACIDAYLEGVADEH